MKSLSRHINEAFEINESAIFIIDKTSREYLGSFNNMSAAKIAQKDSFDADNEEIVTGSNADFEVKADGKKYYKK